MERHQSTKQRSYTLILSLICGALSFLITFISMINKFYFEKKIHGRLTRVEANVDTLTQNGNQIQYQLKLLLQKFEIFELTSQTPSTPSVITTDCQKKPDQNVGILSQTAFYYGFAMGNIFSAAGNIISSLFR